jgi:pSer/pThr/pTyr-binding forkhead associated (FHA) protein
VIVIQPRDPPGAAPASFVAPFTIGRRAGPGAALPAGYQIPDVTASVLHCRLAVIAGRWTVEDLGSRGGTWVNGLRVSRVPVRLAKGDVLRVGVTELLVVPDPD